MLAQFNAKQRTLGLFLNSKPTVIDKLISKNKSSILSLKVEDSEESISDESDCSMGSESTTSDTDTNRQVQAKRTIHSVRMAPIKKHIKKQVLGSKITPKIITNAVKPFKKKAGRPKKLQSSTDNSNKVQNTSKEVVSKKICVVKRVMREKHSEINIKNKEVKLPKLKRKCALRDDESSLSDVSNISSQKNSPISVKKPKLSTSQDASPSNRSTEKKFSPKKLIPPSSRSLALLNATKTLALKKFPILDRWKSGVVVRGRGRPRGTAHTRGNGRVRGRGHGRGAPYLTRSDSPIPILRNGKRRKFSDPSNFTEVKHGKKRKRLCGDILTKSEDFSDEQSSIVTESEYSYCESVSTPKGVEDINREIKTESNNCDSDACDIPDNPTDTNSNVFKSQVGDMKEKTECNSNSDNNFKKSMEYKKIESEKNFLKKDDQKPHIIMESVLRDSDGSFDSDATEDSTQNSKTSSRKKYRRRILEGVWVRRSTRSINLKDIDNDTAVIKKLLNEKTIVPKIETNCDIGNNIDIELQNNQNENSSKPNESGNLRLQPLSGTGLEPLIDFTLLLEESPSKDSEVTTPEKCKTVKSYNQRIESSSIENTTEENSKNKKNYMQENEPAITNNNNTTEIKIKSVLGTRAKEDETHIELKTKSTTTFLGCLQKPFGNKSKESLISKHKAVDSQNIVEESNLLKLKNMNENVNNPIISIIPEDEIKAVKFITENDDSATIHEIITPVNVLSIEEKNDSIHIEEEISAKSFNMDEGAMKNITQKETIKHAIRLSTSEIESMLTNEIDSPVKNSKSFQLNNDLSDTKSDSLKCDNQNESIMSENSDMSFNEILGASISISEFASIPLSTLDENTMDETTTPLEQILNEEVNCKNTNLLSDNEDVCSDEKILSLIDSFCQADNEKVELRSSNSQADNNSIELSQKISCVSDEIILVIERLVQSVLDKENMSEENGTNKSLENLMENKIAFNITCEDNKAIVINDIGRKSEETLATDLKNYFPFKQFDSNNLELDKNKRGEFNDSGKQEQDRRNSVDSKLNMDLDDKDEDMKTCESTEESSSTDSNSHLMDLIGDPPIDNMQLSGSHEDVSQSEYLDNKVNELKNSGDFDKTVDSGVEGAIKSEDRHLSEINNSSLHTDIQNNFKENENVPSSYDLIVNNTKIEESPEERANKESILSALGLQSLRTATEDKPKRAADNYTGTLKAVIKLNRATDKKSGGHKMIFKQGEIAEDDPGAGGDRLEYRICTEPEASTEGVPLTHLGDIATLKKIQVKAPRPQFDLSSSPNIVGAQTNVQPEADVTATESKDGVIAKESNLVIPEKSSSFSIHPGRLCSDVCTYCFGKFGSLDTPCHLAQLKNAERLNKILTTESHLAVDSCLCDGCFRYVDRKANCPSSKSHSRKPGQRRGPLSGTNCSVQGCTQPARHSVRRKWLIKLKKSIAKKLVIDMDKNPHLPFPLCSQHYYWVDYFTVCGICKKRLTRNHMYALGPEADELNTVLSEDGIPVRLSDKLFLCKLCRYYSSLRLKYRDPSQMTANHKLFFQGYRKKILLYHDVPISDSEEDGKSVHEEDPKSLTEVPKPRKKKSKSKSVDGQDGKKRYGDKSCDEKQEVGDSEKSVDSQMIDYSYLESLGMNREKPETQTVDYSSLGTYEGQECAVGFSNIASLLNPLEGGQGTVYPASENQTRSRSDMKPTRIQVKFGNLNIGKLSNLNIGQDTRQGNESRCPTTKPDRPPFLPGERDLKLTAEFDFHGLPAPNVNWERCTSTVQFDSDTKRLWQELQRPYGNQSSFLRHLLILEKHWRAGSLVYSEKPDPRAIKYITSVQNRVQAYEGGGCSSPKPNIPPPPPVIPLSVTSPIVRPPPVSTPSSLPSALPPPLMKIPQPWPPQDQSRKSYNTNFSMPTTQIVRPVEIQRFPIVNKTSAAVGPRPRKPNFPNMSLGRGVGIRTPGSITFQQFKRLQIQRAMLQHEKTVLKQPEYTVQSSSSNRSTPSPSPHNTFVPLISDVRSLAATSTSWNESFKHSYHQQTRHFPPILPKIPKALTVTQIVQPSSSPVLLRNTSLTIEKTTNPSSKPVAVLCPEKPSISVFREPTPNGNV